MAETHQVALSLVQDTSLASINSEHACATNSKMQDLGNQQYHKVTIPITNYNTACIKINSSTMKIP